MMRTMLNRVAFAAVVGTCCVATVETAAFAQGAPAADLMVRIDRLENQIRQLTGQIEQMQYRNQQLEAALRRLQDDNDLRSPELSSRGGPRVTTARPGSAQALPAPSTVPAPLPGGRRSDAFDPAENPGAPGAPRILGSVPAQQPLIAPPGTIGEEPPYGGPAGTPSATDPGAGRPPVGPPRSVGPTSAYAVATAPAASPREMVELGTGYLQRREYALAEETFREFLRKYPSDRQAAEAQYGLGESLFQRQSYHDAANAFVVLSKKYETSAKAPDALLRLGQSLAAINEKELACVAFGDVGRKYPRAPSSVKQAVEREQKRVRC